VKRAVLYYPTISIPDGPWLRRALFYFDEVASIVPRTVFYPDQMGPLLIPTSPEIDFLLAEGFFRAVSPEELHLKAGWEEAHRFSREFLAAVDRFGYVPVAGRKPVRVHGGKLTATILGGLQSRGLVTYDVTPEQPHWSEWLLVEENTARLYMAMLAQYLADLDPEHTVPGTDSDEDENIVYRAHLGDGFPCIETRFQRVVPTPREDVSLADIINFKERHRAELFEYRSSVDELQVALSGAESNSELKHALVRFEERQRKDLMNVTAAMADSGIATVLGSLKTLVKTTKPAFWGAAAAVVAPAAPAASVAFAGMAATATVEASAYLMDRRNEKRANDRTFAFAYVQHAKEERIL
jgi:uncharacterized protein DUF6236